jgi:hypothetical protein
MRTPPKKDGRTRGVGYEKGDGALGVETEKAHYVFPSKYQTKDWNEGQEINLKPIMIRKYEVRYVRCMSGRRSNAFKKRKRGRNWSAIYSILVQLNP